MAKALDNDPVYVAVSKDVRESRLTLLWALRNLPVKKFYLLHVHLPISMNPSSSGMEESEIHAFQEMELKSSYESLHKYRSICEDQGVAEQDVDVSCILADNVGEGIVELIYENNIKRLVMGAAADSRYSDGMVNITSTKAEYVSSHAPQCCKIWLVCNGNLIQTREGRFDLEGSLDSSSGTLSGLDSALLPYEGAGRAEDETESHAVLSPEDSSARRFETMYYEEKRRRLEAEEALKIEKEEHNMTKCERDEARSSSFGVTQILYNEEARVGREAVEELKRAKEEIEDMKRAQKKLEEELYVEYPRLIEMLQEEQDKTTQALLRRLNLEEGESSSHSSSSSSQWPVSNEPPPYFICPISKEIMRSPHVAADGYTYEAEEIRRWLSLGSESSPMTNLKLENHNLTPNLILRSAINAWLQQHPHFLDLP